jgi:hypothetical protein
MPFKIGPLEIETKLNTDQLQEDIEFLKEELALDRMFDFEDTFGDLHEQFALVIDDMLNLEKHSKSMVTAVSASFKVLSGTLQAVGIAWQEMLLTGEMSWKMFGEAMKQMVAQELAAISASALVNALYATAIGFIRLAQWDFVSAASAFTAAATFAAVAAVAGIGAMALSSGSGGGAYGGYDDEGGFGDEGISGVQQANQQRFLTLNIEGNIIGQEEWVRDQLLPQISDVVREDDSVLVATSEGNVFRRNA